MTKLLIKLCVLICVSLASEAVLAGPVRCSVNNQDSSCLTPITTAWQTAPTCPPSAGWTTIVPAKWIGSQYSAPQCNYQAPPTCPPGYDQTAAPSWNGSSWVGLACIPSLPPIPDPNAVCSAQVPSQYTPTSAWSAPLTDPNQLHAAGLAALANGIPSYTNVFTRSYDGPTYSLPCWDRNNYGAVCYVNGANVVGMIIAQGSSASSGQCNH